MPYVPTVDGGTPTKVTVVDSNGYSVSPNKVVKSVTLVGNNAAGIQVPLFTVTGNVKVNKLYGVVTTTLGSNQTAAYWQLNDGAATPDITLATGTTISNAGVGSIIARRSLVSVALVLANSTASVVTDPVAATAPDSFMPFIITSKVSATTTIEFVYSTTNTPTSGAIDFYVEYTPLEPNGSITAI